MNGARDRQRMLETADALQAQLGKQFSMSALYNESGLSRHTVRRHFPTKASLLNAMAAVRHANPGNTPFVPANLNTSTSYTDQPVIEREHLAEEPAAKSDLVKMRAEQEPAEIARFREEAPMSSAESNLVELPTEQEQADIVLPQEEPPMATVEDILWGPEDDSHSVIASDGSQPTGSDNDWIDRRFRIFEKAISILENEIVDVRSSVHTLQSKPAKETASPPQEPVLPAPDAIETVPLAVEFPSEEHGVAYVVNCEPGPPPRIAELELEYEQYIAPKPALEPRTSIRSVVENVNIFHEIQPEQNFLERHRGVILGTAMALGAAILITSVQIVLNSRNSLPPSQPAPRPVTVSIIDATGSNEISPSLRGLIQTAQAGDAVSQTKFGLMLLKGESVPVDHLKAARWIESAAEQGNSDAAVILGNMYAAGVQPDTSKAYNWYLKAAAKHNPKAMHNLGIAFITGSGVKSNHAEAASWFMRAALLGYKDSAFNLAVLFERGDGVTQNPEQALRWYHYAASKGDKEAAAREATLKQSVKQIASD